MKQVNTPRSLFLALSVLLFLSACSDSADESADAPTRYVHSMDGAPRSLDPVQASSIYAKFLVVNLYDTLYRYRYLARPYQLAPNLAAALPTVSANGLTVTIPLRRNVRFIDDPAFPDGQGREVTAQDVVYSLLRHFDPAMRSQGAWLWQGRLQGVDTWQAAGANYDQPPEGIRATDRYTVQLKLTAPFPQLVHTLTQGYAAVVPREAVERYGEALGNRAVGSGPYRLASFDSARALLQRNEQFRQEPIDLVAEGYRADRDDRWGLAAIDGLIPPLVDEIDVEFIAEDASRWNTFYSGQSDFLKVPIAQLGTLLESTQPARLTPELAERFHVEAAPEAGFVYTNFNMADPAIGYHEDQAQDARNRALRCAIRKGFDWETRNAQFFGGVGRVFPGVIPPGTDEYDPALSRESVTFDPDGARQLLEEHGWTAETLPVLEYGFPTSVTERQMFEQFRSFMEAIGFPREKIQPLTFASFGDYLKAYSRREVMLMTAGWTMDYPDAENTLQLYYGPNASPGSNSANFADPVFDALYREAAIKEPSPERTALFAAMNQRVIDSCVTISGLNRHLVMLWNRELLMRPDRAFLGGYFLRFVARSPAESS